MNFNANLTTLSAAETRITERVRAAIEYLRQGWTAQAFLLLSEPGTEKDGAARFALGLCHFYAGELPAAISRFEEALNLFRSMSSKPPGRLETSDTHTKLSIKQIDEKVYLTPMDADFCAFFPKAAEQTVLLALIDSYIQNGMIEEARRLSAGLVGPVFETFKKRMMK